MSDENRRKAKEFLAERLRKADPQTAHQLTGKREISSEDAHRVAGKIARDADRKKGK